MLLVYLLSWMAEQLSMTVAMVITLTCLDVNWAAYYLVVPE